MLFLIDKFPEIICIHRKFAYKRLSRDTKMNSISAEKLVEVDELISYNPFCRERGECSC